MSKSMHFVYVHRKTTENNSNEMLVLRGSRLLGKVLRTELPDLLSWQLLWQMVLPTFFRNVMIVIV